MSGHKNSISRNCLYKKYQNNRLSWKQAELNNCFGPWRCLQSLVLNPQHCIRYRSSIIMLSCDKYCTMKNSNMWRCARFWFYVWVWMTWGPKMLPSAASITGFVACLPICSYIISYGSEIKFITYQFQLPVVRTKWFGAHKIIIQINNSCVSNLLPSNYIFS